MLIAAFTIGLLGSFHCVGMCGPIAMALPYQGANKWQTTINMLLYNLGRASAYALMGALLGALGWTVMLAGYQQAISLILGVFLLLLAFFSFQVENNMARIPLLKRWTNFVKLQLGKLLQSGKGQNFWLVGLFNGFLPCGLVYMGLVGAVATGNALDGGVYMAFFGLGTLPMMLGVAWAGNFMGLRWRKRLRSVLPVLLTAFAILLILRGLNLNIPYSPQLIFEAPTGEVELCH